MYKCKGQGRTFVEIKNKYMEMIMAVVMLTVLCIVFLCVGSVEAKDNKAKNNTEGTDVNERSESSEYTVVIDAGHGGSDPGKVGVNGSIESEINLQITKKLKKYLEKKGIEVVLTRKDENGLYAEYDTNKKKSDMNKRCGIVNQIEPDILVSIHQNSYSSEGVKGAQVFFFKNSNDGEKLAKIIQNHLITEVDNDNGRQHKENGNYYILKNVQCPAVIVECGFLSNYSEAELLVTDEYQEKLAVAIGNGMIEYLERK